MYALFQLFEEQFLQGGGRLQVKLKWLTSHNLLDVHGLKWCKKVLQTRYPCITDFFQRCCSGRQHHTPHTLTIGTWVKFLKVHLLYHYCARFYTSLANNKANREKPLVEFARVLGIDPETCWGIVQWSWKRALSDKSPTDRGNLPC